MRPQGIPEDYIKMKAFPFSLDGAAKDWLYLQPTLFNTWGDMKLTFLEKFFLMSRTASIRKEICGIRQHNGETLHEYWERFNKLCATYPHHHISEQLLIQYFYEGLSMMDRSMIDATSGGALMDKTPATARHLISNMASNTQQFEIRGPNQSRTVNEINATSNQRLENQLTELTSLLTTSNLEFQQFVSSSNMQFQQSMTATIQDLKTQIGQLANTVSQLQSAGSSNLPSQTIPNPRGNASVVTLRSEKKLSQPTLQQLPKSAEADSEPNANSQPWPETTVPLSFPSWTIFAREPESDKELLKMFQKVEINIPLLDAIKQIPKYAKFLKELCVHKRRKMKGSKEIGGVVSALTRSEEVTTGTPRALPKKC
ncbi:hypothetical protein CR513_15172, partial [Mucuna pruriens]